MEKTAKILIGLIVVILIIIGVVYGVANKPQKEVLPAKPIKIGVLADLSGDYTSFLRGIPRGVEMAVEDIKKEVGGKIEVIFEDQKSCNAQETVTIMSKFTEIDKVDIVIGGSCSNTTLVAAPIANRSRTIIISPASSAPTISGAGEYIFRTYISDVLRAKEAARIAYVLGKRKMAIITEISNDAAIELSQGGKAKFLELGGSVVAEEEITKDDKDFKTQLGKIKETNPDVLYLSITGPNQNGLVAKQAKEMGLSVQLVAPAETVEDPNVIEIAGDAVEGLIYVMPGNPPQTLAYQDLGQRHFLKYGEEELPLFVTESYDAVMLGVKAVLASNGTKEDIKDNLYEVSKAYRGVSGNVTFDVNGDVTKPVMFKTIKAGKFVPYEEK